MGAILDLITVLVLILCTYSAARRGFVRTLIGFVGTFLAISVAVMYGDPVANWLRVRYVGPWFEQRVQNYLASFMTGVGDSAALFMEQMNALMADMPEVLRAFLGRFSVTGAEVQTAVTGSASAQAAQEAAVGAIAMPMAQAVSNAIGFLLVFLAAMLLIKLAAAVIDAVMKLPVLRSLNSGLGLALGALEGVIIVCLFAGVVTYLAPMLDNYLTQGFGMDTINTTLLFRHFYKLSPFKRLL
ncbi:MAG: CvpA family protein [Clostridiales bacterium]|nr:CvpA family protein [Clostridiales bacterium]